MKQIEDKINALELHIYLLKKELKAKEVKQNKTEQEALNAEYAQMAEITARHNQIEIKKAQDREYDREMKFKQEFDELQNYVWQMMQGINERLLKIEKTLNIEL